MSNSTGKKAIVVGAGLAGLAAAHRLKQVGFDVTVLEKRDRVGGRVLTLRREGFAIDSGPDAMTEGYKNYQALAAELGLGDQFVHSSPVIGLARAGKLFDIDTRSTLSMVFSRALSWGAKIRFLIGLLRNRKLLEGVDSFRLVESADFDTDKENAEDFSLRVFGRETTDYVIDPLCRLVVGRGAAHSSRLGVLGGLVNWSVPLINIKGGLDVLPMALAQQLDVKLNVEVDQVTESADGIEVKYKDATGNPSVVDSDVCVIAATHDVAERCYPRLRERSPDYLEKLEYLPLVSISLAYDAPTNSKSYVVQVPTVEDQEMIIIFMQHNKAPDRAPEGCSLVSTYASLNEKLMAMSDDQITAWAREKIERLCPELVGHFRFSSVSRWPIAGYVANPGFWLRTRRVLNASPVDSPVQVAGDLFGAGSMESAITWGEVAARRLIEHHADSY